MTKKNLMNHRLEAEMTILDCLTGSSRAIENSEKRGQSRMVNSDVLPVDGTSSAEDIDKWEKIGVKLGEIDESDRIFRFVELPRGWKKVSTDHSMHSNLVDDKGRKRARIFYKAAFYDRSASVSLVRRFSIGIVDKDGEYPRYDEKEVFGIVKDGDREIFKTRSVTEADCSVQTSEWGDQKERAAEAARRIAYEWLNENFPDHNDVLAYWD